MRHSEFLDPGGGPWKLDTYPVRTALVRALKSRLSSFEGVLLDVGCGEMPYRTLLTSPPSRVTRYIGLDFAGRARAGAVPEISWMDGTIPLPDASVDCAVCTEVLEHCPHPEKVLREILRVLRADGYLFLTVPFLWPLHEVPEDHFRYTPFALRRQLAAAGFAHIKLAATGGWDASLAQMLGLWVRRRPLLGAPARAVLSLLVWPCMHILLRTGSGSATDMDRSTMITGLCATARKPDAAGTAAAAMPDP